MILVVAHLTSVHVLIVVTSMVPASVQSSRPAPRKPTQVRKNTPSNSGFGLVPRAVTAKKPTLSDTGDDVPESFEDFMKSIKTL